MALTSPAYQEALHQLNPEQRAAVDLIEGPVLVLAGPGTGKTQILATRIGRILETTDADPRNILCLTYTEAGATAMRARLIKFIGPQAHKISIHTFHGFCNRVIQENKAIFDLDDLDPVSELESAEFIRKIIDNLDWNHPLRRRKMRYYDVQNLKRFFDELKKEGVNDTEYQLRLEAFEASIAENPENLYKIGEKKGEVKPAVYNKLMDPLNRSYEASKLLPEYQNILKDNNRFDFQDMLIFVHEAFAMHEDLLLGYQEQFQYLLVDEYQDTNGIQNEILFQLASYWDQPNLFAVGDDDQSIFRFQGANLDNIKNFHATFLAPYGEDFVKERIIQLQKNYRSSQRILNDANTLIRHNRYRLAQKDFPNPLKASSKVANYDQDITVLSYEDSLQEAVGVAEKIQFLHKHEGLAYKDIAVFYKKHATAERIAQYFQHVGIPIQIVRTTNILEEALTQQIRSILIYLQNEMQSPFKSANLLHQILHFPCFGLSGTAISRVHVSVQRAIAQKLERGEKINEDSNYRLQWRNHSEKLLEMAQSPREKEEFKGLHSALVKIDQLVSEAFSQPLQHAFNSVIKICDFLPWINTQYNKLFLLQEVNTLFDFLKSETQRNKSLTLKGFLHTLDLLDSHDIGLRMQKVIHSGEGVQFMTLHGSKGLEFDTVFMIGNDHKTWTTHSRNGFKLPPTPNVLDNEVDIEDARRLFYVGITRPKRRLFISYPLLSNSNKSLVECNFISELLMERSEELISHSKAPEYIDSKIYADFIHTTIEQGNVLNADASHRDMLKFALDNYVMSVTHLNNFLKCPLRFYYLNLLRIPSPMYPAAQFGSAIHKALEVLFAKYEDAANAVKLEQSYLAFQRHLYRNKEVFSPEQFEDYYGYGKEVLDNYIQQYPIQQVVQRENELKVRANIEGIEIRGNIDRIDKLESTWHVVDYKTGKFNNTYRPFNRPNESVVQGTSHHVAQYGGDYWRQAVFYYILLQYAHHPIDIQGTVGSVQFQYVEQKDDKPQEPYFVNISQEDVSAVIQQIKEVYGKIQRFELEGCGKEDCEWCSLHQSTSA